MRFDQERVVLGIPLYVDPESNGYLTEKDVSRVLCCSQEEVNTLCKTGELGGTPVPNLMTGGPTEHYYIHHTALNTLIRQRRGQPKGVKE